MTATQAVSRVVFTGDILRPTTEKFVSSQIWNIPWLSQLVGAQVAFATHLPIETVAWGEGPSSRAPIADSEISAVYDEFGAPQSIDGWAALYDSAEPSAALDAIVRRRFLEALVIGFELPPIFERALIRHGAIVINARIHPVRFLDDVFLAIRSSDADIRERLAQYAIREDFVRLMANVQGAAAVRKSLFTPDPNSLLICGQMPQDSSQIYNGAFARLVDFRNDIIRVCSRYDRIYYKTHPLVTDDYTIDTLRDYGVAADRIDENSYYLMSHKNIVGVMAVSSGVCVEAGYFNKNAHLLLGAPLQLALGGAKPTAEDYVGVYNAFMGVDFWRDILAFAGSNGLTAPERPNRLRLSLGNFWGYNQIDSDGYIAAAMQTGSALERRLSDFSIWAAETTAHIEKLEHLLAQSEAASSAEIQKAHRALAEIAARIEGVEHQLEMPAERARLTEQEQQLALLKTALEVLERERVNRAIYSERSLIGRVLFRENGRPIRPLRVTLFRADGRPREIWRRWIVGRDGVPRKSLRQWMTSSEYLSQSGAYRE